MFCVLPWLNVLRIDKLSLVIACVHLHTSALHAPMSFGSVARGNSPFASWFLRAGSPVIITRVASRVSVRVLATVLRLVYPRWRIARSLYLHRPPSVSRPAYTQAVAVRPIYEALTSRRFDESSARYMYSSVWSSS